MGNHFQTHKVVGMGVRDHYRAQCLACFRNTVCDLGGIAAKHEHIEENRFGLAAD
jgi:hypothetical protein